MSYIFNTDEKKKIVSNGSELSRKYFNGELVFSSAQPVTYHVDSGISYTEDVESGASCLSPKTFTPSKSGWTFVGWREDKTANSSVLSSKVMGDTPITLYAVFSADVTVTYYNNSTTASKDTKKKYYNNGNTVKPSFTLSQASKSGWSYRGWSTSNAADANINNNITYGDVDVRSTTFTRDSNITLYGIYYQVVSLTYNGNGASSGSVDGYWTWRMYNSSNKTYNPTTTLKANGFSRDGYSFTGWNLGAVGATVTLDGDKVAYSQWKTATVLSAGQWQAATSVNNNVMVYNSNGYLTKTGMHAQDGETNYNGPTFTVDTTGISKLTFKVFLGGYQSTDGVGRNRIRFTMGGKTTEYTFGMPDNTSYGSTTQTLTLDVSGMSGNVQCTTLLSIWCRREDDASGWTADGEIRMISIAAS